ncbi:hypothetical protein IMZ48_05955 [Candidatus Bathyarchaeota archaeon]|nr:hypothetical protein [Candidatus Bathyarchaeota archaeon]
MLCQACEAHFEFSHPNHIKEIIRIKRGAIRSAAEEGLGESLTQKLRDELRRYETGVDSISQASEPPCPWNTEDETDYDLPNSALIGVWGYTRPKNEVLPPRPCHELRESARSSGCRMCVILAAMAAYAVPEMDKSAVMSSHVWLDQGTCRPTSIYFDLLRYEGGKRLALLKLHLTATSSAGRARVPKSLY